MLTQYRNKHIKNEICSLYADVKEANLQNINTTNPLTSAICIFQTKQHNTVCYLKGINRNIPYLFNLNQITDYANWKTKCEVHILSQHRVKTHYALTTIYLISNLDSFLAHCIVCNMTYLFFPLCSPNTSYFENPCLLKLT